MANEIRVIAEPGLSLSANVYQPDGTARGTNPHTLTEVGTSGTYLGNESGLTSGDSIQVFAGNAYQGGGVYQPLTTGGSIEVSNQITCSVVSATGASTFMISGDHLAGNIANSIVMVESAGGDKAFRYVKSHNEATGEIILDRALPFTPQTGDAVYLVGYLWKSKVMA